MSALPSFQSDSQAAYRWTVRVIPPTEPGATAYARNHSFSVHAQADFNTEAPYPNAVEYLLGALAADLVIGLRTLASRRGIELDELEARVTGTLRNPLVFLGVVGEGGETGLSAIEGTVYVHGDTVEEVVRELWDETLRRSPLYNTLKGAVAITLKLQLLI